MFHTRPDATLSQKRGMEGGRTGEENVAASPLTQHINIVPGRDNRGYNHLICLSSSKPSTYFNLPNLLKQNKKQKFPGWVLQSQLVILCRFPPGLISVGRNAQGKEKQIINSKFRRTNLESHCCSKCLCMSENILTGNITE